MCLCINTREKWLRARNVLFFSFLWTVSLSYLAPIKSLKLLSRIPKYINICFPSYHSSTLEGLSKNVNIHWVSKYKVLLTIYSSSTQGAYSRVELVWIRSDGLWSWEFICSQGSLPGLKFVFPSVSLYTVLQVGLLLVLSQVIVLNTQILGRLPQAFISVFPLNLIIHVLQAVSLTCYLVLTDSFYLNSF